VSAAAEITVDYGGCGSAFMPCAQRKQQLAATWGFECQCELCSAPAAAVAASDARRQQMAEADARVSKAVALQDAEAAVAGKRVSVPENIKKTQMHYPSYSQPPPCTYRGNDIFSQSQSRCCVQASPAC
jgi:hypothetical protein